MGSIAIVDYFSPILCIALFISGSCIFLQHVLPGNPGRKLSQKPFHLQLVQAHQRWLLGKDICGRIYISGQGINAQLSGPAHEAETYAAWVEQQPGFQVLWVCLDWCSKASAQLFAYHLG